MVFFGVGRFGGLASCSRQLWGLVSAPRGRPRAGAWSAALWAVVCREWRYIVWFLVTWGVISPAGESLGVMPGAGSIQQLDLSVVEEESTPDAQGEVSESQQSVKSATPKDYSDPKAGISKPFILSEGLPPVPHKLAARILRGEFVDMAELLRDNLEAQRRVSSLPKCFLST